LVLREALATGTASYFAAMDALALHRALEAVMGMVNAANLYFADSAPWALKSDPERRSAVLAEALDATRRLALLVRPFIPDSAGKLLDQLGIAADARDFNALDSEVATGTPLPAPQGVFPRWTETLA
jgi:methionyl-tRNA synthetase